MTAKRKTSRRGNKRNSSEERMSLEVMEERIAAHVRLLLSRIAKQPEPQQRDQRMAGE